MLVTTKNFAEVLRELRSHMVLSLDVESTGLRSFHCDTFFSIIIATAGEQFYLNFQDYPDLDPDLLLGDDHLEFLQVELFGAEPNRLWCLHHFKFDAHMLATRGLSLAGHIHDTKVGARLLRNDHMAYSLAACAERIGLRKSTAVDEYIKEHGLWDWIDVPGKKTREKLMYFDRVPFEIITHYGEQDARITFDLGIQQLRDIANTDSERPEGVKPLIHVVANEARLLRAVFHMEQLGVQLDKTYCMDGIRHETGRMNAAEALWLEYTQVPFRDSPQLFGQTLPASGKTTEKGAISYDAEALEALAPSSRPAQLVLDWRDAKKRLDFFHGFLHHADTSSRIHANFDQAGTVSGRFSCSGPNLQQLTKEEDAASAYPIRRALVPTPGFSFFMLDYDQQEYRLMLDYAGVYSPGGRRPLIDRVLAGLDVHQATAETAGISRSAAKTTNFSILFGAGLDLLAARLRVPRNEAQRIKRCVFDAAPEIETLLEVISRTAKQRGYVSNWLGRRWYCSDPQFAYKAPNFICQGGGADVIKVAIVRIQDLLHDKQARSRIVLQVHDEIVLEVHDAEHELVPECRRIMEEVYAYKFLPLTVGVDWSRRSLADKEEWKG